MWMYIEKERKDNKLFFFNIFLVLIFKKVGIFKIFDLFEEKELSVLLEELNLDIFNLKSIFYDECFIFLLVINLFIEFGRFFLFWYCVRGMECNIEDFDFRNRLLKFKVIENFFNVF